MAGLRIKSLKTPDETRQFVGKGRLDLVKLGPVALGYATFEPGWRWSEHVRPLAGTSSCQTTHLGYCLAGRMHIRMDDGEEQEIKAGDSFTIAPGHDAWVVGNETCLMLDFTGYEHYAERRPPTAQPSREQPAFH